MRLVLFTAADVGWPGWSSNPFATVVPENPMNIETVFVLRAWIMTPCVRELEGRAVEVPVGTVNCPFAPEVGREEVPLTVSTNTPPDIGSISTGFGVIPSEADTPSITLLRFASDGAEYAVPDLLLIIFPNKKAPRRGLGGCLTLF